jgi:hypothetical protein
MAKKSGEQRKNSYDHADLENILSEIEEYEDQQEANRARTRGDNTALAKKIANAKKTASKLGIPKFILDGAIATKRAVAKKRAAEEEIDGIARGIPPDGVELWADAVGQLSFLQPEADEPEPEKAPKAAATKAAQAAQDRNKAEQAEGGKILDELGTKH